MTDAPPQLCLPACIACGYDIASLNTRLCPECGYAATDEDVTQDARRRLYLEMTARQTWLVWVVTVLFALWGAWGFSSLGIPTLIALFLPGAVFAGGVRISRHTPILHRRILRRSWWMSSLYWLAPVAIFQVVATIALRWLYWEFAFGTFGDFRFIPAVVPQVATLALCIPLWYYGWRRATRLAGVPQSLRTRATFRRGAIIASLPVMIVFALTAAAAIALILLNAMDR